jgi:hypothetical protein
MSNHTNQPLSMTDKIIKYAVISLISIIVLALIIFLFIPKLSLSIYGFGSYGATSSTDSSLEVEDLKIVRSSDFDDLKVGDIILFNLTGSEYGNLQGIKVYRVMAIFDEEATPYVHVHSTGTPLSFPWRVTEEMYMGTVVTTIPILGAVTGFLSSGFGIAILVVNLIIIGIVIYLLKSSKFSKQSTAE